MNKTDPDLLENGIRAWEDGREAEALTHLLSAQASGNMKAGRYLALIRLQQAAERGDITSKVILGMLCEYGLGMKEDPDRAKAYYLSALAHDHPNREGFMLAAGAELGLGRMLCLESSAKKDPESAAGHLQAAEKGGGPRIQSEAKLWRAMAEQSA